MCGVVARLGASVEDSVTRATRLLAHRGIRSKVQVIPGVGALGHVRLPIVGLGDENDQPRRVGDITFGFVGEILDFKSLPDYGGEPCDVDTVFRAINRAGFLGLRERDGFWGIAAINGRDNTLHVLTDYLAQKPMYYRADRHVQAAASEIDPLVSMGPVSFDQLYISDVIKWGYCPDTTRTPFNEIKHLLPGEHVVIDDRGGVTREIVDPLRERPMYAASLKSEFIAAIRRRVESSDVPVACLLSGGLDSSIAYKIGSRYADLKPYYAIPRILTDLSDDPEYQRAKEVAAGKKIEVACWNVPGSVQANREEAVRVMQEPIDLGSLIPQMALASAVKEDVCLTGDGADEVFGGYGRSERYDSQYSDVYRELVAWHLPRLDRVMMRRCIEVRTPFLARRVVEAALGITHDLRRKKDMLKILFKPDLPKSVLEAPKMPLRTERVQSNRELVSKDMVKIFRALGHYRPIHANNLPTEGAIG